MGQCQSSPTPLSLMTEYFKEVKKGARDLSVKIKKDRLITFCTTEWPSFHVGWPSEGTFNLETAHQVRDIILWPQAGHPDQVPYVIVWENIIVHSPPWVTFFASTGTFYHSGVGDTGGRETEETQGNWTNGATISHLAGRHRRTSLSSSLPTPRITTGPRYPITQGRNTGWGTRTKYSPQASPTPGRTGRLDNCPPLTRGRSP